MLRARQEGDRETDEGLLKGPVCVYVCLPAGTLGRVPHHVKSPSIWPRSLSQMWSRSVGNPKFHHLDMAIHTHAPQPHFHFTSQSCV